MNSKNKNYVIKINEMHKWFGSFHVLKNINLEVGQGERIVICGPSGSGKSTLIRCINRLEEHQKGEIIVDGMTLDENTKNISAIRSEVGMVFQQFNLWSHMTILQNVTEAPITVLQESPDEVEARARALLKKVGILDKAGMYPAQLSGGQQQRAGIARALAMNPKAILLDEPTSALDPEMEQEVVQVIKALADEGRTMILVTHDMNLAYDVSDHVVFLHEGKIL